MLACARGGLFDGRTAGLLDAAFNEATLPVDQFQFRKPGQIGDVIDAFIGTEPGLLGILVQECRQLQGLEMVVEQQLWGISHGPGCPTASLRNRPLAWRQRTAEADADSG